MLKIIRGIVIVDCEFLKNEICRKTGEWCDEECPKFNVTKNKLTEEDKMTDLCSGRTDNKYIRDVVIVVVIILFTGFISIFAFQSGVADGKKQDRLLSNEENRTVLKSLRNTNIRLESLNHDMQTKIVLLEKVIGLIESGKLDKEVKKRKK